MKQWVVTLTVLAGLGLTLAPRVDAQVRPAPRRVETALPPAGSQLPTWNPLPPPPGIHDEPQQTSIEARVLHFLQHLFGGPNPQPLHSPFSNECGQRPCPFDMRN